MIGTKEYPLLLIMPTCPFKTIQLFASKSHIQNCFTKKTSLYLGNSFMTKRKDEMYPSLVGNVHPYLSKRVFSNPPEVHKLCAQIK